MDTSKPAATLPSQFPLRAADGSDTTLRRSSDALRQGSHPDAVPYSPTMVNGQVGNQSSTLKDPNDSPGSGYESDFGGDKPTLRKVSSTLTTPRAWLGLQPMAPVQEEHDHAHHNHMWWSKVKITLKEPMAEFWGTFILVLFGDAGIAQVTLGSKNPSSAPGGQGFGDWQSINWAYAVGLMLGVYVAGDSGAYLNPAVTFTSCILRKIPWRRLPMYLVAQTLGAFCAAGVVYGNYYSLIDAYEGVGVRTVPPATNATAGIFATYPTAGVSTVNQFFDQFIASALLVFVIFALKDDSNKGNFIASGAWFPLGLFFLMFGIGACFGVQTGFAINFARDFGPRLMTYALGYGNEVWTAGNYYFWIPMIAPFVGCLTGGILYDMFIYTGESPINTPWFGLAKLVNPKRTITERLESQKEEGII